MKKTLTLSIAGLMLITSPIILANQHVSDMSKGLLMGIGIGLLFISLLLQLKKAKA